MLQIQTPFQYRPAVFDVGMEPFAKHGAVALVGPRNGKTYVRAVFGTVDNMVSRTFAALASSQGVLPDTALVDIALVDIAMEAHTGDTRAFLGIADEMGTPWVLLGAEDEDTSHEDASAMLGSVRFLELLEVIRRRPWLDGGARPWVASCRMRRTH